MKANLIRTMTIAIIATSISAFAQTAGGTNSQGSITKYTITQPNGSNQNVNDSIESDDALKLDQEQNEINQLENQDKVKQEDRQKEVQREDREWDKALMGIY
jgi:hypothetical protein